MSPDYSLKPGSASSMETVLPLFQAKGNLHFWMEVANKINAGVAIIDNAGLVFFWNGWLAEKSGLSHEAATGKPFLALFPELLKSRLALAIDDALRRGLPALLSQSLHKSPLPLFENPRTPRERLRQSIQVTPIECDNNARFCLLQINDVSISVKKEGLLREQAEALRIFSTAIEQSPASVVITDLDANIRYVNPQFTEATGYTSAEAVGQNPRILQSGKMPKETYVDLWDKLTSGQEWHGEFLNKRKNGELYWEDAHIAPVKDAAGMVTHYVAVKADITERKQAEEKLLKSEASLHAILDNSPYLVWLKDTDGRFIKVNQPFFRTTGLKQMQDVLGKTDLDLWPKELAGKYRADDAEVLASRQQKCIEEPSIMDDGQVHWVETYKTPIMDDKGQLLGTTGFAQDITGRKQYIDGLRKAQQLAQEIAAAKSNFLANMSHEIRTPMNAIIGLSQLALNKQTSSEVRGYLEKILNSSDSLMDILNDILDLSKTEAGRMVIEHSNFDLDIVLENLNSLFLVRAEDKYLDFSIEVSPDVPRGLAGDALRLQQVLSNLLGNAIKFTEHGKVTLRIGVKEIIRDLEITKIPFIEAAPTNGVSIFSKSLNEQATLLFRVEDTGIGIAQEDIAKLFQPFSQVDNSISRRFGGTGLGLSISHSLLRLMGSDIRVESAPGKGTTFSFELVLGIAPHAAHDKAARRKNQRKVGALSCELRDRGQPLAGARILVAEDDIINQQVVREFLELSGVTVALANNGKEVLELLDQGAFDAVLMDVHMPVMDGIEATRQIRAQARFARLPVIALTADIASEDRESYLADGMNDFVAKPIHPEELIATLLRWVKRNKKTAITMQTIQPDGHGKDAATEDEILRRPAALMSRVQQQPTVLIVDDVPTNVQILAEALHSDYRVKVAGDGREALRIALREPRPDLILLDVMMPGMDGFEVCRHLKENPLSKKIPVIFVTAKNEENDEESGLDLGAVDYITKPFSIPTTKVRIRNHIRLKQQNDLLESISLVDALTHIPNRRRFDEAMDAEWKRAAREKTPLSMLMIDIDHFKEYNDCYGHGAGDACLQSVAAALLAGVSRPGDLVARYGGEEFVAILPETGKEAAAHIAARLCKGVRDLKLSHAHSGVEPFVTTSIGCATMIPSGEASSPNTLLDEADKMLYKAKNAGRNRVC